MKTVIVLDKPIVVDLSMPESLLDELTIGDCMDCLKRIVRHNGALGPQVNVMAHSKYMDRMASVFFDDSVFELKASCLCHDVPEVFLGDIVSPVKGIIRSNELKTIDQTIFQNALEKFFGVDEVDKRYKYLDELSVYAEVYAFGGRSLLDCYVRAIGHEINLYDIVKFSEGMVSAYKEINSAHQD